MKIKCVNIFNDYTKQYQDTSPWLTLQKEYIVLSIKVYDNRVCYNIIDDSSDQSPGSHNATQFEVISHKIPSNWSINPGMLNLFTLGPKSWEEDEFWERCYEGDLEALKIYHQEVTIIINEEGM